MKKELISDSVEGIDKEYIKEAAEYGVAKHSGARIRPRVIKWVAAAACLALVISIGFVGFSIAAEAREYAAAVEFFEENGLSTEGLSRDEIKAVYRDITTNSFTYGKTAEVIHKAVPGFDIDDEDPTPEELATDWHHYCRVHYDSSYKTNGSVGIRYVTSIIETIDAHHTRKSLQCYRGNELLWCVELGDDYYTSVCTYTEFGTVVTGETYVTSSAELRRTVLALVDDNGVILWEKYFNHGFDRFEYINAVVDNCDGTFAVFSFGDLEYICLGIYDTQGNELSFSKIAAEKYRVSNAVLLGDGYLVHAETFGDGSEGSDYIAKMDRKGNISESFSYESEDCIYVITDMIEFGGRVYLSAYAVPKQEEKYGYGTRGEINDILEYIFSRMLDGNVDPSIDEEITPMVLENYTALLLICDPAGGVPETFYSVRGALGAGLAVNDSGQLEWNVESIRSAFCSLATSSFTIGGTCRVYRYTFGSDGMLIGREATGDETMFRR